MNPVKKMATITASIACIYLISISLFALTTFYNPQNEFCKKNGFDYYDNKNGFENEYCYRKTNDRQIEKKEIVCQAPNRLRHEVFYFQTMETSCYFVKEAGT